jgi:serine/threonine protein kinase
MLKDSRARLWILTLAIAVLVALFGWWGDTRLQATLHQALRAELEATLRANVTALDIWITNQMRLATIVATESAFRSQTLPRLADASWKLDLRKLLSEKPSDGLDAHLQTRMGTLGCEGIVVNTNFEVVAASGIVRARLGLKVQDSQREHFRELFKTGQPIMITPFRPPPVTIKWPRPSPAMLKSPKAVQRLAMLTNQLAQGDTQLMQIAVPIRNNSNEVLGAFSLIINPDREFSRILSVARFGNSGETYAFDDSGLAISRSRFDPQLKKLGLLEDKEDVTSALRLYLRDPGGDLTSGFLRPAAEEARPLTHFIAEAIAGQDGLSVEPKRDYRGVPVVGIWRWLPEHNFGVVTQQDASEAYQALRILRFIFLLLFLLLLLCATGFFIASYMGVRLRHQLSAAELHAKQLGQYQLEEKIGEGGMGVVYRARHALLRRETAIKLLLPDRADAGAIARFEREVQLTCQLTHPNTIQVYDYGHTPDGVFYYAMEYLEGLNLKELVELFGHQSEGRVIHVLVQVCDALEEAHQRGLVHRDIKPANVFLTLRGGIPDSVKVLDFGLVREVGADSRNTDNTPDTNELVGTPLFMSPESITTPGRSDPRSDLYSIGALGYYLLTGRHVFEGETVEEIARKHCEDVPVPPSQVCPVEVSSEIENSILLCLQKAPEQRPQSAAELKNLLLCSPRSADWGLTARAAWWTEHQTEITANLPPARTKSIADKSRPMRIDLTTRFTK